MEERFGQSFEKNGFERIRLNVNDVYLYHKTYESEIAYVLVLNDKNTISSDAYDVQTIINQISHRILGQELPAHLLTVVITSNARRYGQLVEMVQTIWFVDSATRQLIIYENQNDHFYGVERLIENEANRQFENEKVIAINRIHPISIKNAWDHAGCSASLVLINTIIFLWMNFLLSAKNCNAVVDNFALSWVSVFKDHEYYRILTHMFLHGGFDHIFNNMLVLFFVGKTLESVVSKKHYLCIYFTSGIVAAFVSMGYNMMQDDRILSLGASGAIFGLVGAVAYIVVVNQGRIREISKRQIIMFVVLSLYGGFTATNVDNAAHIGGFIAGLIIAAIRYKKPDKRGKIYEY